MRTTLFIFIMTTTALAQTKVTFDEATSLPAGWKTGITGAGTARWEIVRHDSPPSPPHVLKQSGVATYCWAAKTDIVLENGFVEVKFNPLSGKEDQAGGLVFRFQNANNYYVVRGNIVAIHHHMTHEQPRMLFLHYWGRGSVAKLAQGLKRTLEAQKAVPAPQHQHR